MLIDRAREEEEQQQEEQEEEEEEKFNKLDILLPITMAARSKVWVCGHLLVGFEGLNPAGILDIWVG